MRLKNQIPAILAALFLFACSGNDPVEVAVTDVPRTENVVGITSGEPMTIADLSIEGMSCEHMCGGAIKKALAKLGVQGTEIKMSETEAPNHAIVTYDSSKLNDGQLIQAIQALHDGQYKVVAVDVTKQVKSDAGSAEGSKAKAEEETVSVIAPKDIVLPSILALIGRLLRV